MKKIFVLSAFCVGLGLSGAQAGCLGGAAAGGVAGHMAGHHAVLGAAAGCAIGHHEANKAKHNQAATSSQNNSH